jgi:hypothetical protein
LIALLGGVDIVEKPLMQATKRMIRREVTSILVATTKSVDTN